MNEINHLCLSQFHLCQSANLRILECQSPKICTQGKGHTRLPKCGKTNSSGFRAYSGSRFKAASATPALFKITRTAFFALPTAQQERHPSYSRPTLLMSSWIYSRHKTQVGLLSRHFRFLDAGPCGANSEYVKDQQHYRSPALADLQTGTQIPLWPQGKGNFQEIFKGKI